MAKTTYVSASKLIGDAQCPYKQKHQTYRENDILRFGKAVDAGVSGWLKGEEFQEVFAKSAAKLGLPLTQEYIDRALKCFQTLEFASDDWLKIVKEDIITVQSDDGEVEFYGNKFFQVDMIEGVWGLRGAFDMADFYVDDDGRTILRIIDWKTGYSEADDIQLACYALAAWKKYSDFIPWDFIETRFFYLDQGGKSPKTMWTKETLVSAFKNVEERVQTFINRKEFPRTLNKNCGYCEFADTCEVYQTALTTTPDKEAFEAKVENLSAINERIKLISAIAKITTAEDKKLKKLRNEILVKYPDGYVVDGRLNIVKEKVGSYDYDLPSIFERVQKLTGKPPFHIMKFDSAAFDVVIKEETDKVIKKALKEVKRDFRTARSTSLSYSSKLAALTVEEDAPAQIEAPKVEVPKIEDAVVVPPVVPPEDKPEDKGCLYGICKQCNKLSQFHDCEIGSCRACKCKDMQLAYTLEDAQAIVAENEKANVDKLDETFNYGVCLACGGVCLLTKYQRCQFCKAEPNFWKTNEIADAKTKQLEISKKRK